MKGSHRITRLATAGLIAGALAAPAAARAAAPAPDPPTRPSRSSSSPSRRPSCRASTTASTGRPPPSAPAPPAASSCSSASAAPATATATSHIGVARVARDPARRTRGRHCPPSRRRPRRRAPGQRTHIWSSNVNNCPCVLTLPTRSETSTAERRRVSGTTSGQVGEAVVGGSPGAGGVRRRRGPRAVDPDDPASGRRSARGCILRPAAHVNAGLDEGRCREIVGSASR